MKPTDKPLTVPLLDAAKERARYKEKVARRTREIRESGDRWLEKLAQMPRDGGAFRKP